MERAQQRVKAAVVPRGLLKWGSASAAGRGNVGSKGSSSQSGLGKRDQALHNTDPNFGQVREG